MTTSALKSNLRSMVRSAYDLQKLRIQAGLRLCANFRSQLGQDAGKTEEELDDEAAKIIDRLRDSFRRLTDGIAKNRTLPAREGFHGDDLITDYTSLVLVSQYLELERVERQQFVQLGNLLPDFPIYTQFLQPIRGIGPAMAGVIISEFDIHRARHPSSMWAYAGLDVVTAWKLRELKWERVNPGKPLPSVSVSTEIESTRHRLIERADGEPAGDGNVFTVGDERHTVQYFDQGQTANVRIDKDGYTLSLDYTLTDLGGRSRRRAHLIKRTYTTSKGEVAERDSITFNPFLKTKLMGVLAGSFLRSGSEYRKVYDDYKHRLQNDPRKKEWTKAHINDASKRYMVKIFLADLYDAWRKLEGLPVSLRYHEAKLGIVHGGEAKGETSKAA